MVDPENFELIDQTVIDGGLTDHIIRIEKENTKVTGFTLQNGGDGELDYYYGLQGGVIEIDLGNSLNNAEPVSLEYLSISDGGGNDIGSLVYTQAANLYIDYCTFTDESVTSIYKWYPIESPITISNSVFYNPEYESVFLFQGFQSEFDVVSHSLISNYDDNYNNYFNGEIYPATLANCITNVAPLFCDPEKGDYSLAEN